MANEVKKSQSQKQGESPSKPDQRNGFRDPSHNEGGNQQVSRDLDNKDRNKLGEQEGQDRAKQSGQGQQQDAGKSPPSDAPDQDDEMSDGDAEDETKITQRQPSQK